jgi:hypothetical protein
MRTALVSLGAAILLLAPNIAMAEEVQTLKERLSDKASDSQRVDNCRVPAERRGATPRPDCPTKTQDASPDRGTNRSISQKAR